MKKFIAIISVILIVGLITFFGINFFKSSNVEAIEIIGDIQTIYFVNSTNEVNFNDADLKITYKDGSVKIKKLKKNLVSIKDFSTSVVNNGTMKVTYKSTTINVGYAVVWTGLYYLSDKTVESFTGSDVSTSKSGPYVAGVDNNNNDKTTTTEMIYFGADGTCDYYSRSSSTAVWYLDDGYFDKSFNYKISGNSINVNLGENVTYSLIATFSKDGELSLTSVEKEYKNDNEDFLSKKTERKFNHYEMKGNRTITKENIEVKCSEELKFKQNSEFKDSNLKIYLKVTFENDNFLKTVYVRFNESMFISDKEFTTKIVTFSTLTVRCFYNGVGFDFTYSVY